MPLNRPQTWEGVQVWDLVGRLGGQLRVVGGGASFGGGAGGSGAPAVIGWEMSAAFAIAAALGVAPLAVAELLPEIEAVMVRRLNEQLTSGRVEGNDP